MTEFPEKPSGMYKLAPRKEEEPEYAACLLVCGGPIVLAQPVTEYEPTSSLAYRSKCNDWYDKNIAPERIAGYFTRTTAMDKFTAWWIRYKLWLMKNKHG